MDFGLCPLVYKDSTTVSDNKIKSEHFIGQLKALKKQKLWNNHNPCKGYALMMLRL